MTSTEVFPAMKILILSNNSGGLYGFRHELISRLMENGEVYVSTPFDDKIPELMELGCRLIETPIDRRGINPVKDFSLLQNYKRLIKEIKPDLVIAYTIKPNIYGGLACDSLNIPFIANITGLGTAFEKDDILKKLVTSLYKRAFSSSRTVFFENTANKQYFIDRGIIPDSTAYVLNGAGVNTEFYSLSEYPETSDTQFLFIGRIMKEKGIEELFTAMKKLVTEGLPCSLTIIGEMEEDYVEIIKEYERQGWLKYGGYQQDVRPYITDCSCFVLPSYHEGMANTLLECASMGRPLITSDIPGCREAVIDGETGFLCRVKDSDSLYNAMKSFMELSYDKRKAMGIAGRQHMQEVFAKEKVVGETIRRINTVMNRREEND